ncbi:GPI mannosyltransferase 1 [Oleoguttula sp. CCFEE 6159]|nr:GPI mannosyltransferase 1 [Oleoguttula sp. CCFEE 6159]
MPPFFSSVALVFSAAILLRGGLLFYGLFQDAHSPFKYTDIDYFVFTDAARFVFRGLSPYTRDTYRYTPLLAWLIYPTTWGGQFWFSSGKVLFALGDVVAGWLILLLMRDQGMQQERALKFASIWLLNPMVAQISTRGSSEGLLGVIVTALLWAVLTRRVRLAGVLLGFSVHFKIYPFVYTSSIIWWLDDKHVHATSLQARESKSVERKKTVGFINHARVELAIFSFLTFMVLNVAMYSRYGTPFIRHTYQHHLTRIDHRHNFSPYNTLLYLNSSPAARSSSHVESLAFIPQLFLSVVAIPVALAKKDLASTMLAQTFAFVAFNKVCTSQYFLWYMVFLPLYLSTSSLVRRPRVGITALVLWIVSQALWLQQGYQLEFLGQSTFIPGLWGASLLFFVVNIWILGIVVDDVGSVRQERSAELGKVVADREQKRCT